MAVDRLLMAKKLSKTKDKDFIDARFQSPMSISKTLYDLVLQKMREQAKYEKKKLITDSGVEDYTEDKGAAKKAKKLKKIIIKNFNSAMDRHELQKIKDVKAGRFEIEKPPVPPQIPSLKGKKIVIAYKDPEAVQNSIDEFVGQEFKGLKNTHLINDEYYEQLYKKLGKIGEYLEIEIDLDTGKKKIVGCGD